MNKNLIHLGPLVLIIAGYFWSAHINPGALVSYNIGFGIGMFLIPAIPGLIIALIKRSFSKKKAIEGDIDVLDGEEPKMKKTPFMFYFSLYSTIIGIFMFLAIITS